MGSAPRIVVTGASFGIGRALAEELARRERDVVAVARNASALEELQRTHPNNVTPVSVDLTQPVALERVENALPPGGRVQCLVHSAGIADPIARLSDLSNESWSHHFAINVDAPLRLTKALLPRLHGGRVLFIGSDSATTARPGWGAYCTSKAASAMLHECLKLELAPHDIHVSSAKPGATDTHILQNARDASADVFGDATEIRGLYDSGGVTPPDTVAKFLAWLLLDVRTQDFASREWDRRSDTPASPLSESAQ